jgi:hypothetical protein
VPDGRLEQIVTIRGQRQFLVESIEPCRVTLAASGLLGLSFDPGRQSTDGYADHTHHREGQYVLEVVDDERVIRCHKKEIEGRDTHQRR